MKIREYEGGSDIRAVLTGMITNRTVLGAVADKWENKEGLFDSRWENLIGGWCVKHYRRYGRPPLRQIATYYEKWAEGREGKDRENSSLVKKFLATMSEEYSRGKRVQITHVIDLAQELFTKVKLRKVNEKIDELIADNKVSDAAVLLREFDEVRIGGDHFVRVLEDKGAIWEAFDSKSEALIRYPDGLGLFFGDALEREGFISLEGPEKRGKTTILLDMAWRGMLQGRKVAFFEIGDLSRAQIMRRFMVRAAGRPLNPTREGRPVRVPLTLDPPRSPGDLPEVAHQEKTYKKSLEREVAWERCRKILGGFKSKDKDLLRLWTFPANSITVAGVNSVLDRCEREDGWKPDIVAFDYIDLFAAENGKDDNRLSINKTWVNLSAMRQRRRVLVLGATQTNAESYEADIITMKHYSENKLKRAHVTGSVGLNQNDLEKAMGVYRFNWVVGREWEYDPQAVVYAAGSAALMNPLMLSVFDNRPPTPARRKKRERET